MIHFQNLKTQVYECWKDLSDFNRAVIQPENFKPEVAKFGDLRKKQTWINAYCSFWAKNIYDSNGDNRTLVSVMLDFQPNDWNYELRHQILEQFLMLPHAIEMIQDGLEEIFGNPINTKEEKTAYGVFELVSRTTRGELTGNSARPVEQQLNASPQQS